MTEPQAYRLDKTIADAVVRDGLPRQAIDQLGSGTLHVLFRNNAGLAESVIADAWIATRGPLPNAPTPAEIDAALLALQQAAVQAQADAAALRQQVLATLQTAVGVPFANLNTAQLKAVVEALAWQSGALNKDTTLRPPSDWIDRRNIP